MTNGHHSAAGLNKTLDIAAYQVGIIRQVGIWGASFIAGREAWDVDLKAGPEASFS